MSPNPLTVRDDPTPPAMPPTSTFSVSPSIYTVEGTGMVIDMRQMLGPFILTFNLELFFMGVVLVLSINYFVYIKPALVRPGYGKSFRTLETVFISVSLVFSLVGSGMNVYRAYDVFAAHALDPLYSYFSQPYLLPGAFIGAVPTVINQTFLTSRAVRFLGHSQMIMPRLSRRLVRYTFAGVVVVCIIAQCIGNFAESILSWKAGSLFNLAHGMPDARHVYSFSLLYTISGVCADTLISFVLTGQLWWARRKLDSKLSGGTARRVLQRLMLVTFPSGLLQALMQLSQLICYEYATEWTLFSISLLPKIYNISLILAISAPHIIEPTPTPSNVQLPTIQIQSVSPRPGPTQSQIVSRKRRSKRFSGGSWRSDLRGIFKPRQGVPYPAPEEAMGRPSIGKYSKQEDLHGDEEKQVSPGNATLVTTHYPPSISTSGPRTPRSDDRPPGPDAVTSYQSSNQIMTTGSMPDSVLFFRPRSPGASPPSFLRLPHTRRRSDSAAPSPRTSVYGHPIEALKEKVHENSARLTTSSPAAFVDLPRVDDTDGVSRSKKGGPRRLHD